MGTVSTNGKKKVLYDCVDCPAFCCSVYDRVQVTPRDVRRLAKHFGVDEEVAKLKFTKMWGKERVLRRKKDTLFKETCQFMNTTTRGCGIYHARPAVCREFPTTARCAYYDLLAFEREQQDDPKVLPLIQLTFRK
jgi:Fe-S-cluster containining protein